MRGPNVSRTRQILFPCTAGAVHTWHGPEVPSDVLYDCYRVSSGLKPGVREGVIVALHA